MIIEDQIIRAYLQAAHDRGGSFQMAMNMMADRLIVLEDRLLRAGVDFPQDKAFRDMPRAYDNPPPAARQAGGEDEQS